MDSSADWQHTVRVVPASPAGFTCDRIELRVQALEFATRGWPIVPGTYVESGRWVSGPDTPVRDDSSTDLPEIERPEPVRADWQQLVAADSPAELASWWSERPHSVLVATGTTMSAIEVDADLGRRTAQYLRGIGVLVPIVATPLGEWYFLTAGAAPSGAAMEPVYSLPAVNGVDDAELAEHSEGSGRRIREHGTGSWIPLPPTAFSSGVVHWRVKPSLCSWRLPSTQFIRSALRCVLLPPEPTRTEPTTERLLNVANLLTVGR